MDNFKDRINHVLDFWFGKPGDDDFLQQKSFWYKSTPENDKLVEDTLKVDYERAKDGSLDSWTDSPRGCIALIILLDQVPRNIHRDKPEAYQCDDRALEVAKLMVTNGWDKEQPNIIRRYIYSPFNHSEVLSEQEKSVQLFEDLADPDHLWWANEFHRIIKENGRFPHRDIILGRHCAI